MGHGLALCHTTVWRLLMRLFDMAQFLVSLHQNWLSLSLCFYICTPCLFCFFQYISEVFTLLNSFVIMHKIRSSSSENAFVGWAVSPIVMAYTHRVLLGLSLPLLFCCSRKWQTSSIAALVLIEFRVRRSQTVSFLSVVFVCEIVLFDRVY